MSERHPLATEGSWVELKDPSELRYGDKLRVLKAVSKGEGDGVDVMCALYQLLIVSWQLPTPLPIPAQDINVVYMLEMGDGDALEELVTPARERLFPGTSEPETPEALAEAVADPASPTTPSVDS